MWTISSSIIVLISSLSTAYCTLKIIRWALWRLRSTRLECDIEDETYQRIAEIAEYANLPVEKVLEVIVIKEALKAIKDEERDS